MFYSKLFYTSSGGYKMCIRVDVSGYAAGKGTHVSVFTEPLEGHYDEQLQWLFLGTVTYELLNQLADDKHHSIVAIYDACRLIVAEAISSFSLTILSPMTQPPTHSISLMTHCTSECQ